MELPEVWNSEPYNMERDYLQLMYTIYRLQELEMPESQARTAMDKQKLAVDAASRFAELTGYVIQPQVFEQTMLQNLPQLTANYVANTASPEDIANIRQQMKNAGYPEADTADPKTLIGKFMDTIDKNDPSQKGLLDRVAGTSVPWDQYQPIANYATGPQDEAVRHNVNSDFRNRFGRDLSEDEWQRWKQKAEAGTLGDNPRPWDKWASGLNWNQGMQSGASGGGALPTFAGANLATNPRPLSGSLGLLGMNQNAANSVISGAPMANQVATVEMQKLNQNPQNIAQSLLMAGYNKDQVNNILMQTPAYAELTGQQQQTQGAPMPRPIAQPVQPGATLPGMRGPALGQPGATLPGQPGGSLIPDMTNGIGLNQNAPSIGGQAQANPLMPVAGGKIQGRNLNYRQTRSDLEYNPDRIKAITGVASNFGTSPESLLGDFMRYAPKGRTAAPTRFF